MGYITLAEPADDARPAQVGERRGLHDLDLRARRDHRPHGDDTAGPGAPHGDRAGRRRPARGRAEGRRRPDRGRHVHLARGRSRPETTPRASPASVSAPSPLAAERLAGEDRRDPRAPRRRDRVAPPDRRHGPLESRGAPARDGARARGDGLLRGAEPAPAGRRRSRRFLCGPRLRRRRRRRRGRSRDGRGRGSRLRHGARRGPAAQPAARRGAGAGWARPRSRGRALRAARLRRGRKPPDRLVHGLPRADRARPSDADGSGTASRPRRSSRSARRGSARGRR